MEAVRKVQLQCIGIGALAAKKFGLLVTKGSSSVGPRIAQKVLGANMLLTALRTPLQSCSACLTVALWRSPARMTSWN
jgi:hypothetical protein